MWVRIIIYGEQICRYEQGWRYDGMYMKNRDGGTLVCT